MATLTTQCSTCGDTAECVELNGKTVCRDCKPLEVQKLREGVTGHANEDGMNLRDVAANQRYIMYCILLGFGVLVASIAVMKGSVSMALLFPVQIGLTIAQIVFIWRLARALKASPILYLLLAISGIVVPLLALVGLLLLNDKANKVLKQANIKVGLLGANLRQFDG